MLVERARMLRRTWVRQYQDEHGRVVVRVRMTEHAVLHFLSEKQWIV
jgi:hypothetical protein